MIEFNISALPIWLVRIFFYRIDFIHKGIYSREMFLSYHSYRENYYFKMNDGWKVHNLSNYVGIITIWYFKPD